MLIRIVYSIIQPKMIDIKDIGELRQRVVIQSVVTAVATNGERTDTFSAYSTRWAKVDFISMDETAGEGAGYALRRARFTFRYDSAVTENYRLVYGGNTYNIRSIEYDDMKRYMAIMGENT